MKHEAKRERRWPAAGIAFLAFGLLQDPSWATETRTVAAGSRYGRGAVHRFLLGSGYRTLWTEPFEVEILDLAAWSGGLVAEKKGGGKQTSSLKLEGRDGREWKFRSIDKDPTAVLPEVLQETFAARLAQDQIGASHPGSVLVVDALTEAAGIPHVKHRIVLLPDDERLGEFRQEFAGMLGTLEEDPSIEPPVTPGFSGFDRLVDTDELERILDADASERVDSRSFLRARLLDLLIGDSDWHRKQWDWARERATGRFVAVPSDRDLAFVRFDGLLLRPVRSKVPQLVTFDEEYPGAVSLHWQSRFLDRRHLADLEWPAWRQTADELQARLGDAVIVEHDGTQWHNTTPDPAPFELFGVFMVSENEGYAVGAEGTVVQRSRTAWKLLDLGLEPGHELFNPFHSVWVDPEGGVWAVGGDLLTATPDEGMLMHRGKAISNEISQ